MSFCLYECSRTNVITMIPMVMLARTVPANLSLLIDPISDKGNTKPDTIEAYIKTVIKSPII